MANLLVRDILKKDTDIKINKSAEHIYQVPIVQPPCHLVSNKVGTSPQLNTHRKDTLLIGSKYGDNLLVVQILFH